MSAVAATDSFREADASGMPDLSQLDDRHKSFWILKLGQRLGMETMTPAEISDVLRDVHGYRVPRQRIEAMLAGEREAVARRRRDGRRAYQLMAPGAEELAGAHSAVVFTDPTRGFTGLREAQALLGTLTGEVRVCDPYADLRTLDMLAECTRASSIRLLTHNIKSRAGFKQAANAFAREHGKPLDVAVARPGILHDRYAIHDEGMLLLGTSLNGLGGKQSFVVTLGQDIRATVLGAFETTWQSSSPL